MPALLRWFQGIDLDRIIQWLMFAAAALLSISVHESSHAFAAWRLGDDTAKRMGRVSLNPLRHLDPMGFVMMVVAHFGWAKPVPVNMYRFKNPKTGMALTAAAGPLSNVVLALISGLGYWLLYDLRLKAYPAGGSPDGVLYYVNLFCYVCFVLNAGLAVFNLIPVSPLDGSKILAIFLPDEAYGKLMRYERYGMLILMALLFTGVLDGPLDLLRSGLMDGIDLIAKPLAKLITGV